MAYNRKNMNGTAMTKALGQMVGLLLVLYVFDRLVEAVIPLLYSCATGFTINSSTISSTATCYNASNVSQTVTASGNAYFGDAVTLIQTLLPVVGILGAFEIIWATLKATGLV